MRTVDDRFVRAVVGRMADWSQQPPYPGTGILGFISHEVLNPLRLVMEQVDCGIVYETYSQALVNSHSLDQNTIVIFTIESLANCFSGVSSNRASETRAERRNKFSEFNEIHRFP